VDVHYVPAGGANAALVITAESTFALRELPAICAVLAGLGIPDALRHVDSLARLSHATS
jgi:hypothetical protein